MNRELLKDKAILITGGNAGIGKAIATKFAAEGANLAIFGTNAETGEKLIQELKVLYPDRQLFFYSVDVANHDQVAEKIKEVTEQLGGIDALVNNAGITRDNLLMKMTEEDWDRVMDVNLKSCFNTSKAVIRGMIKARRGKIINITSVVGLIGNPGQTNYAASKAGMIGFSQSLAKELASRNIAVNCIAPGFIRTAMTDQLSDSQKEAILHSIPFGKLGEPEDIANTALFLASDLSSYITGQVITVDGGMVM